ncbi:soluble NSF attachment protein [Scleroderma yunnanense]
MISLGYTSLERANQQASVARQGHSDPRMFKEAAHLYRQAAKAFKREQRPSDAARAYILEAGCRDECNETHTVVTTLKKAAEIFIAGNDIHLAVETLKNSADSSIEIHDYRKAAYSVHAVAYIYLSDSNSLGPACKNFQRAANLYLQTNAISLAVACIEAIADIHIIIEDYGRANELYELAAKTALESPDMMDDIKDYLLLASLCALATQNEDLAKGKVQEYMGRDLDPKFGSTSEGKFVMHIFNSVKANNGVAFDRYVEAYRDIVQFDDLTALLLEKITEMVY